MKVEAEMEHIVGSDILGDLPVTPPVGCELHPESLGSCDSHRLASINYRKHLAIDLGIIPI